MVLNNHIQQKMFTPHARGMIGQIKLIIAYKVKLYPNKTQRNLYTQHAGLARVAYNWALDNWCTEFAETGTYKSWAQLKREFNQIKYGEFPWCEPMFKEPSANAIINLDKALKRFFKERKKTGQVIHRKRKMHHDLPLTIEKNFPRFKSYRDRKSFTLTGTAALRVEYGHLRLPSKLGGWVKYRNPDYIPLNVRYGETTVSQDGDDWYLSVIVDQDITEPEPTGDVIGVDVGISKTAYASDGYYYENPKITEHYAKQLARLNKKLSRQTQGSSNWHKTKSRVNRLYAKIRRTRNTYLHNVSADIVGRSRSSNERPSVIVLEDLTIKQMLKKDKHFNRHIHDASMFELQRQLTYKAAMLNIGVHKADKYFPSSKTCSNCGYINNSQTLNDRVYNCPNCGFSLDRDYNAALNLANLCR